jgi:DNA damage-binding protein 1
MDANPIPTVLFTTANGMIGVIASIPQEEYEYLLRVQQAINKVIKGVGGLDHALYVAVPR